MAFWSPLPSVKPELPTRGGTFLDIRILGSLIGLPWKTWTPTYTNFTLGNGTVIARYVRIGDTVIARLEIVFGSTTTIDAINPLFSMPVTALAGYGTQSALGTVFIQDAGTAAHAATVKASGTTNFLIQVMNAAATYTRLVGITALIPMTWTTSDKFSFTAIYEAA